MILSKEKVIEHFNRIEALEKIEKELGIAIRADETLSPKEMRTQIEHANINKHFDAGIIKAKFNESFKLAPDDEGYIKVIAELNINVYTKNDHSLLKKLLKSKGFESNEFEFDENTPAFKAMIGSNTITGLKGLINEVDELCGKNNIFFEVKKTRYNDGATNVNIIEGINKVIAIISKLDSPIMIGSKVNDVFNFNVNNNYNFSVTEKGNPDAFVSFDKHPEKPEHNTVISFIVDKLTSDVGEEYKKNMLERNLSIVKSGFLENQSDIQRLTTECIPFKPEKYMESNPNISILRSYQLEFNRSQSLYSESYIGSAKKMGLLGKMKRHNKSSI